MCFSIVLLITLLDVSNLQKAQLHGRKPASRQVGEEKKNKKNPKGLKR